MLSLSLSLSRRLTISVCYTKELDELSNTLGSYTYRDLKGIGELGNPAHCERALSLGAGLNANASLSGHEVWVNVGVRVSWQSPGPMLKDVDRARSAVVSPAVFLFLTPSRSAGCSTWMKERRFSHNY